MKAVSLLGVVAAFAVSTSVFATPLLTPTDLGALVQNSSVQVIDIRTPEAYAANHIPGAVSAPYGQWRGPAENPGQLPPMNRLAELVRSLGLDQNSHAVVVSSGANPTDFGSSARVYWTLKYLGLTQLSILNGGVKAWTDAGLPQDKEVPAVVASNYTPVPDARLIATQEHVLASVENPQTRLIDARPANFFLGEVKAPTALVPGTIRNAVNLEHDKWFKPGTSIFVSADEARKIAASSLPETADETIAFCNTGHWAATDWFALSEIVGQKDVKLYPASLAGWTQAPEALPMDNVPSRGSQLLNNLKELFGKATS